MTHVVIGTGYGDEGKGMVVDYLASLYPDAIVIRYSSGPQAGHTVSHENITHTFSHFGSGTLRGLPTFWSKNCPVDPILLVAEREELLRKGINPAIFIDPECEIITPWERAWTNNKYSAFMRHGTCGVGVGATVERASRNYHMQYMDIFCPATFNAKYEMIVRECYTFLKTDDSTFLQAIKYIRDQMQGSCTTQILRKYAGKQRILEGSQGLLLDKDIGFFPHVTRANVGLAGMKNLALPASPISVHYVTRSYATRHGKGPLINEFLREIPDNPHETNTENEFQGKLRKAPLCLNSMALAIQKDKLLAGFLMSNVRWNRLYVTCADVMPKPAYSCDDKIIYSDVDTMIHNIMKQTQLHEAFVNDSPKTGAFKQVAFAEELKKPI